MDAEESAPEGDKATRQGRAAVMDLVSEQGEGPEHQEDVEVGTGPGGEGGGRRCAHVHPSGKPCGGYAIAGSARCFAHDPEQAAKRDDARHRGGQAGRVVTVAESSVSVRSLGDVLTLVETTINDVRSGRVDVRVANAVGYLANVAVKVIAQSDLESRLEALESILEPERRRAVSLRRGA